MKRKSATSASFPTTPGAWQRTRGGQGSAFVMKLDGAGNVAYATLFGGVTGNPYPSAIAVNRDGEAFVTGGERLQPSGQRRRYRGARARQRLLHRTTLGARRPL